ncbi:MAG: division/cell wall cluster transcriptional repressor MraZ [Desulfuromonadales bacterium]|nr:division/cell wall cluster transcriptional repressor MraZ [Desulfuromonadales bacterium]
MNFQGEYINLIDPKGRASIPSRFRETLNSVYGDDRLVVTKNIDGGLTAYPLSRWPQIVENVKNRPVGQPRTHMIRLLISPAQECTFDKQGRIQIPLSLRSHANLAKEIVVVGHFDKIEIFNQTHYDQVTQSSESFLQDNPQDMADMGF